MQSNNHRFEKMIENAVNIRTQRLNRRSAVRNMAIAGGSVAAITIGGGRLAAGQEATPDPMDPDPMDPTEATPVDEPVDEPEVMESPFADDIEILNYALTIEHLEAAFYRDGLAELGVEAFTAIGFQEGVFNRLALAGEHEADHVEVLSQTITELGGEPVQEGVYEFGYTDAEGFLGVAQALEDTGVGAYTGAAQFIQDPELLTAALTIHGIEGRHASYLAVVNGVVPYPEAFEPALSMDEVLGIAGDFIVE